MEEIGGDLKKKKARWGAILFVLIAWYYSGTKWM